MSRHLDRLAFAVAVAFGVAAIILALLWTDAAHASVEQTVSTDRVATIFLAAEAPVWLHNLRGRSVRIRCSFAEDRGHGRARGPIVCRIRVYRTRDHRRLLGIRTYDLAVVGRVPSGISRDDGTGTRAYSSRRSLAFDLRAKP